MSNIPVPFQDRIIVSKRKPETMSAGGIIVPEIAIQKENEGYVVAVGPQVGIKATEDALKFAGLVEGTVKSINEVDYPKVGDHVIFGDYSGTEIKVESEDGTEYLIMREADIMCKK